MTQCWSFEGKKSESFKCFFTLKIDFGSPMPDPCSGKNILTTSVIYYIQKRRRQALLFSFENKLLPKLVHNKCLPLHESGKIQEHFDDLF